jgi:hypothetical protein
MLAAVVITECSGEKARYLRRCKLAAVMIHRMLQEGCAGACMQARCCCDSQNALVQGRVYPCAAMHASCHDPQNALVEEGCYPALPCKLAVAVDSQNVGKEGCAIPALPCKLAAVVIHRMLWWKVCYPRCHASSLLL